MTYFEQQLIAAHNKQRRDVIRRVALTIGWLLAVACMIKYLAS